MVTKTEFRIPISNVDLSELERGFVDECMDTGIISGTGGFVRRFEQALATWVGRKHAIAVSNGTVALEVTLAAFGIGPEDEVIVPALTFVAPVAAVRRVGATPVIVDVNSDDWCISANEVGKYITRRTKAIIGVSILGHPADFDALYAFGIPVIEDAAQAHGAKYKGRMCGSNGLVSTFSFFANKALTMGEGGAILTDDDDLASRIRLIVNHGMRPAERYFHTVVGTNARLSNVQAAIGLGQVMRADELTRKRQAVADYYRDHLDPDWHFRTRPVLEWADESAYLFTLMHMARTPVVMNLNDMGIDTRNVWLSIDQLPIYRRYAPEPCGVSRWISEKAFSLPTSSVMTNGETEIVVDCLRKSVEALK